MNCRPVCLVLSVLALSLLGGGPARASFFDGWSYQLSLTVNNNPVGSNPYLLTAHPNADNAVVIDLKPGGPGAASINLATVDTLVVDGDSEVYQQVGWDIRVHLSDNTTGESDDLTFHGVLDGTLGGPGAVLVNTFSDPTQHSKPLAGRVYTLSAEPPSVTLPQGFGFTIAFKANVSNADDPGQTPPPPAQTTPEPSGLVLAGLALPALGLRRWRRRAAARV